MVIDKVAPTDKHQGVYYGYFGWYLHCKSRSLEAQQYKYICVRNGRAIYLGNKEFDLYELLNTARFNDDDFHRGGITVMNNPVCTIKVMQRIERTQQYLGNVLVDVFDQFLFSINGHKHWGGFIRLYPGYRSIVFALYDSANDKEYILGKDDGYIYTDSLFSTQNRSPIKPLYSIATSCAAGRSLYTIRLPKKN